MVSQHPECTSLPSLASAFLCGRVCEATTSLLSHCCHSPLFPACLPCFCLTTLLVTCTQQSDVKGAICSVWFQLLIINAFPLQRESDQLMALQHVVVHVVTLSLTPHTLNLILYPHPHIPVLSLTPYTLNLTSPLTSCR